MYLLDSCICIDLMRGKLPLAYELMRAGNPHHFAIPAVVEAELRTGVEKSSNLIKNRLILDRFLNPYKIIPFDSHCARIYGMIRSDLEQQGRIIGNADLLIAATAVASAAILVTNNVREFKRVNGLSVESWYETPWDEAELDQTSIRS